MVLLAGLCAACSSPPETPKIQWSDYEPQLAPEAQRRALPKSVSSALDPEVRDRLERSPAATASPSARLGFAVRFSTSARDPASYGFGSSTYDVECHPLRSGHLRCMRRYFTSTSVHHHVEQGVYAFGGLVELVHATFAPDTTLPPHFSTPRNLLVRRGTTPSLPDRGLDVVWALPMHDGTHHLGRAHCAPALQPLPPPPALEAHGPVSTILCRSNSWERDLSDRWAMPYFWLAGAGVALPATLFIEQPSAAGSGFWDYLGPWRGLIHRHPASSHQLNVRSFRWLPLEQ